MTPKPLLTGLAWLASSIVASAQGAAFIYQGKLTDGGQAASGIYDLRFAICDTDRGGVSLGVFTNAATDIRDGLFTVTLDFGESVFSGGARWLEVGVRSHGVGAFDTLAPRQQVARTPYAIHATVAQEAAWAGASSSVAPNSIRDESVLDGSLLAADLAPDQVVKSLNTLRDVVELVEGENISVATAPGTITLSTPTDWHVSGNAGVSPAGSFLGTTDDQGLELRVNNQRALRLESTAGTPNVIGGSRLNAIAPDATGAFVGGGTGNQIAAHSSHAAIGGGSAHSIDAYSHGSAIGGGETNRIGSASEAATIAGGRGNEVGVIAPYSAIGGGRSNSIVASHATIAGGLANSVTADFGTIAGGGPVDPDQALLGNRVFDHYGSVGGGGNNRAGTDDSSPTNSTYATVGGGGSNWATGRGATVGVGFVNEASGPAATISGGDSNTAGGSGGTVGGGYGNNIRELTASATIGGGEANTIEPYAHYATVGGGWGNAIRTNANYSTISGGSENTILLHALGSTISGGYYNTIQPHAPYSIIAGGLASTIHSNAYSSTIGGGEENWIQPKASYAVIPGGAKAMASHYGQHAFASGGFGSGIVGSAQTSVYVVRRETNNDAWNELFLDGDFASERMTLPSNSTWTFDILIGADGIGANSAGYQVRGVIKNVGGTTSFVGIPATTILGEDVAAWDAAVVADDARDALVVQGKGVAGVVIRWVASVRTVEVVH